MHAAVAGEEFGLTCAANLAIAAAGTRFTLAYANIGASPDGGSTYFLPCLVGYKKFIEMIMQSEHFDALTAHLRGLVPNQNCPVETMRIGQYLGHGPARPHAQAKRLVNQSLDPLDAQVEQELQASSRCLRGADLNDRVTPFVEEPKAFLAVIQNISDRRRLEEWKNIEEKDLRFQSF